MTDKHTAYLALGTNLGDKSQNLERAIQLINNDVGRVTRQSDFIATAPWGYESANEFLNACIEVTTTLSPLQLLDATQRIERSMGRTEKSVGGQYHDRIIDIDLLLYDHIHLSSDRLTIPHPLMWQRDFVTKPLQQICDISEYKNNEGR